MSKVVIVPIAFDLDYMSCGVVLGAGTLYACDHAITQALALREAGIHARILTTACEAGPEYHHVMMGKLMASYIEGKAPVIRTEFCKAPSFDTIGEIWATAKYCSFHEDVTEVKFCVKKWHARRVRVISRMIFGRLHPHMSVSVLTHPLPAPITDQLLEWPKIVRSAFNVRKQFAAYEFGEE